MLKAGYAAADITPGRESSLIGYPLRHERLHPGNRGVEDPLAARVLCLSDGTQRLLLVSLDLCILETDLADALRVRLAARAQTRPEHVLLACSHTHSGPFPRPAGGASVEEQSEGVLLQRQADDAYTERLALTLEDLAAEAQALVYPVRVRCREAACGLGYDRRVMTSEGVRHCWNPQEYPDLGPKAPADTTCTVVVLEQENGTRRHLLWSLGMHPVCLGGPHRAVSGDWPAEACRTIEELCPDTRALFFLGAAGDVHPWIATQEDPRRMRRVGQAAGAFVATLSEAAVPVGAGPLRITTDRLAMGDRPVPVTVVTLGEGAATLRIVALPVELFSALGREIRSRLGGMVLLATNTNGWTGYWPTREAYAQGGYEVKLAQAAGREPGSGERLVDAVCRLAGQS